MSLDYKRNDNSFFNLIRVVIQLGIKVKSSRILSSKLTACERSDNCVREKYKKKYVPSPKFFREVIIQFCIKANDQV